jgi:hypothetical protein
MPAMTESEIAAFLAQPIICRIGCLDDDGAPYVVPTWYEYADGGFYLVPRARADWARFLARDGRAFLCIDAPSSERVLVKGVAEVLEQPNIGGRWMEIARRMAERYRGPAGPDYIERTREEPRWLLFVRPERITSSKGGWAKRYKHSEW